MTGNEKRQLFDNNPIYSGLSYNVIVGIIQLLTDDCMLSTDERNGWYINFIDFRNSAIELYREMQNSQKIEFIH